MWREKIELMETHGSMLLLLLMMMRLRVHFWGQECRDEKKEVRCCCIQTGRATKNFRFSEKIRCDLRNPKTRFLAKAIRTNASHTFLEWTFWRLCDIESERYWPRFKNNTYIQSLYLYCNHPGRRHFLS